MVKLFQIIRSNSLAIILLILCGLVFRFYNSLNKCEGLASILLYGIYLISIFFLSLVFLIKQGLDIYKIKEARKTKILTIAIVFGIQIFVFVGKSSWKEERLRNNLLSAKIYPENLDMGELILLNQDTYFTVFGHIDWSCSFTNTYEINRDTLFLKGNPFEKTRGIISNEYLLKDSLLIPVKTNEINYERTDTMKINNKRK